MKTKCKFKYSKTKDTQYLDMIFLELSQFTKATTGKEFHLTKERDYWKSRAIVYRDIIRRTRMAWGTSSSITILAEADRLEGR